MGFDIPGSGYCRRRTGIRRDYRRAGMDRASPVRLVSRVLSRFTALGQKTPGDVTGRRLVVRGYIGRTRIGRAPGKPSHEGPVGAKHIMEAKSTPGSPHMRGRSGIKIQEGGAREAPTCGSARKWRADSGEWRAHADSCSFGFTEKTHEWKMSGGKFCPHSLHFVMRPQGAAAWKLPGNRSGQDGLDEVFQRL